MDISLNEFGRQPTKKLSRELESVNIKTIYSSDLKRAIETAEILNKRHGVKIFKDFLLKEID